MSKESELPDLPEHEAPRAPHHDTHFAELLEFLTAPQTYKSLDLTAEWRFDQGGYMQLFEEAGILPRIELEQMEDAVPENEADERMEHYEDQLTKRQEVLRHLYLGAWLGHLRGQQIFRDADMPWARVDE